MTLSYLNHRPYNNYCMAATYRERGSRGLLADVTENVEEILRRYDDPVTLDRLSEEYVRTYDDDLVDAVRPHTAAELQERYRSMLPSTSGPVTPGPSFDRLTVAAAIASPVFFSCICEAVDRLGAEGRVERDPVGATPRIRYTGPSD